MRALVRWVILAGLTASLQGAGTAQDRPDELSAWVEAHARAVRMYAKGERDAALSAIDERTLPDQRRIVRQALALLQAQDRGERPSTIWVSADAARAGALHMEAALAAYRRADAASAKDAAEQIKLADAFLEAPLRAGIDPTLAPRWELAIGLTALADGQFGAAATILDAGSAKYPRFVPLQLACGSAHESMAMLPATPAPKPLDVRQADRVRPRVISPHDDYPFGVRTDTSPSSLARVKAFRDDHLSKARRALDRVTRVEPANAEAAVRLAHIEILEGKDEAAANRLEPIVARTDLDARLAFLTHLFLGDVRARLGQSDRARTLLEAAIAVVPSGQSAHMALVRAVRASGDHDQASVLLHRMLNAPIKPDDPMIGYRFGQYWVPDPLLETLRQEALR